MFRTRFLQIGIHLHQEYDFRISKIIPHMFSQEYLAVQTTVICWRKGRAEEGEGTVKIIRFNTGLAPCYACSNFSGLFWLNKWIKIHQLSNQICCVSDSYCLYLFLERVKQICIIEIQPSRLFHILKVIIICEFHILKR